VEKLLNSRWSDLSREMRPRNAVGALRVLYIGWGDEVRVGGGRVVVGGGFSIPAVFKPKRRGRGDARAPLDEGNEGGTGGGSLPLPLSMGGHPMAVHDVAAPTGAGAAQALSEYGDDPGWAGLGRIGLAEQAGCENFQGNDLGYQGESGRIDNGLWKILFRIFKQRFGF
jgi:hypothetical protein